MYKRYLTLALVVALLGAFSTMAMANSVGVYFEGDEDYVNTNCRLVYNDILGEINIEGSSFILNEIHIGTVFRKDFLYIIPFLNLKYKNFRVGFPEENEKAGFYLGWSLIRNRTFRLSVEFSIYLDQLYFEEEARPMVRMGFDYLLPVLSGGETL